MYKRQPKDLSDKLIQAYVDCDKLCNYIHLPVQSGSDDVLMRMNRKYNRTRYLELVGKLRRAVPDITISTDIIVGFPGETEKDFQDTLDLVRKVGYDSAFTFLYSICLLYTSDRRYGQDHKDQVQGELRQDRR